MAVAFLRLDGGFSPVPAFELEFEREVLEQVTQ
jgi:hypothetical protein